MKASRESWLRLLAGVAAFVVAVVFIHSEGQSQGARAYHTKFYECYTPAALRVYLRGADARDVYSDLDRVVFTCTLEARR